MTGEGVITIQMSFTSSMEGVSWNSVKGWCVKHETLKNIYITKDTEIENRLTVTRGERGGDCRGKG